MSTICHLDSRYRNRVEYNNPSNFIVDVNQVRGWVGDKTVNSIRPHKSTRLVNFVYNIEIAQVIVPYKEEIISLPYIYVTFLSHKYTDNNIMNIIESKHSDAQFVCVFDKVIGYDGSVRITNANNSIDFDLAGLAFDVTIPNGNYANYTALATQIAASLNASGAAATWTVTYSTTTGIFTITCTRTGGAAIVVNIYWAAVFGIGSTIGFVTDDNIPNPTANPATLVGDNAVGLEAYSKWALYKCNHDQTYRFETFKDSVHFKLTDPDGVILNTVDTEPHTPFNPLEQVSATFKITPFVRDGDYDKQTETLYSSRAI